MESKDVSVIRLAQEQANDVASVRALFADALAQPGSRVLADLSGLSELGGSLIAAVIIVSRELGPDARFAVFAPAHILRQMHDWQIDSSWACFGEWSQATAYLCEDAN